MSKIVLPDQASGFDVARANSNKNKIQDALNNKVLWRDNPFGEPNEMLNDLDMNSKRVYNLPEPILEHEAARKKDLDVTLAQANDILTRTEAERMLAELAKREAQAAAASAKESEVITNKNIDISIAILQAAAKNSFYHYKTKAEAEAATIPENSFVQVFKDESMDNSNIIYKKEAGQLVFQADLDILRKELADNTFGAKLVAYANRTVHDELSDYNNARRYINTPIDGITSNQEGIETAVSQAKIKGEPLYWPPGLYISTDNIPGFWDVTHYGPGIIKRGDNLWYITPKGDQRNTIRVTSSGTSTNDGLSLENSTTVAQAFLRLRYIGEKSLNGRWRIHLSGNLASNGVRFYDLPPFKNRLEIFGDEVALTETPTTVWDGSTATEHYAIRGEWSNAVSHVFLHFRNIKFTNWNKSENAGGVVIWAPGIILSENIHTDFCSIGAWYRQCYVRHVYGVIANSSTYGVGVQYGASGNIGGLNGEGITFRNCGEGVNVSRQSTGYIQGSFFTGCRSNITCSRNSRIRPQANIHNDWTLAAYYLQAVGVLTPDNGQGFPDKFNMTPSGASPVLRIESGSKHSQIHLHDNNTNSLNTGGSLLTVSGAGQEILLSQAPGVSPGDFIPARVPAYWFYSSSASLDVTMYLGLPANAAGKLELRGGPSRVLASITIPAVSSPRAGEVRFKIFNRSGSSIGRYLSTYQSSNQSIVSTGSSDNLNNSGVRSPSEDVILYRLYWIPSDSSTATFADMVSKISA